MRGVKNDKGFTLVEVLAALLVFSLSIIGLSHAGTQSAQSISVLDDKMLAGIVADNQLVIARNSRLAVGAQSGQSQHMAKQFTYRVETVKTEVSGFYQINVEVRRLGREQLIMSRTAFMHRETAS
ncbi:MAG: type II secretion system minor pseudopilin GspI [Maricaulaceae bacterium]